MVMMMEFAAGIFFRGKNFLNFYLAAALYVWVKVIYSKHWPYTVAHTIDCVCIKY